MRNSSRTAKSLKNSSVAIIIFAVDLLLQFFSRKIFLVHLGTEVLGLNTTATNLLQFLNLAEFGIGTAVGFSLYKPFFDNDTRTISEIVALQGKLYRRIACIVISGAAVLMCFFPWIFAKMELPLWYAYASFGVLLFSALLSYFVNYKQILLSANQKEYKIQYSYKAIILVKIFVQAVMIKYLENGYVWWLILEVMFAILASAMLNRTIKRTYPFIISSPLSFRELNQKYPILQTKIKQVFVHKISGFAMLHITSLIIYTFVSLTVVAIYGNYMLIMFGLARLASAFFEGVAAGVGNLVAEGNREKISSFFAEYFSIRFLMETTLCFGMITLAQPFIILWLGEEYLLGMTTLYLMSGIMYIYITRGIVGMFLNAYGFYSDIWSPIIEVVSSILLSVTLGYFWGINGILSGQLISLVGVYLVWKPIFLFHIKLKFGYRQYVQMYCKHLFLGIACAFICSWMLHILCKSASTTPVRSGIYGACAVLLYCIVLGSTLYLCRLGFRRFVFRLNHYRPGKRA